MKKLSVGSLLPTQVELFRKMVTAVSQSHASTSNLPFIHPDHAIANHLKNIYRILMNNK